MNFSKNTQLIVVWAFSLFIIAIFIVWAEMDLDSLKTISREDHYLENVTALFLGLSSIFFVIFAKRSQYLKDKKTGFRYSMTICWAVLMFVFMGEEISWGQRMFGLDTPESLQKINAQRELNIHNLEVLNSHLYISIMQWTTGLLLPLFALTDRGKYVIQKLAFPVCPPMYIWFFIGGYLYSKYYNTPIFNDASEVKEFLLSVGMVCFSLHGVISPCTLFRVCRPKDV